MADTGRGHAGILFWPADLIQAAIRGDREDLARAELARLEEQAARTGLAWPRAAVERCRGLLAPKDDFDAPVSSGAGPPQATCRWTSNARARSSPTASASSARAGASTRVPSSPARSPRSSASAPAAGPGTPKTSTARPASAGARPDDADAVEELTTTELRVARAAVAGKANKVIAQEQFLSVKTVEAHLTRVYRKYGVSSRTELAARMRELGLTDQTIS